MTLQTALNDFERHRDHATRFPGERRTTTGLFSGSGGRLVHVDPGGQVRDFSYALSGLAGVDSSRFGLRLDDELLWFDDVPAVSQSYHEDTALVETDFEHGRVTVSRYDLTVGDAHLTHVAVRGDVPEGATLVTLQRFAPEGQDSRVGRLDHGDAVEVFHRDEHDFLGSATTVREAAAPPLPGFEDVLRGEASTFPGSVEDVERREGSALGGDVLLAVDLADRDGAGRATLASLLTDRTETSRAAALARLRELLDEHDGPGPMRATAEAADRPAVPESLADADAVRSDLRVLSLLSAPTGARIAAPDFDPFYVYSGGYGYTWFRDDAEVSRFLLEADRALDLGLDDWHERSARFYRETQLGDGTWPHRVWADTGELAPGWANARQEAGDDREYQADQTASVVAFLATYLRERDPADAGRVEAVLAAGLDGLDATLADDDLPAPCQNAWENATGRFTHTAATFLAGYAALARAPVADGVAARARERADAVHDALNALWAADRGVYAMRMADGVHDERLDASTLALVDAHVEYAALSGGLDDRRRQRLVAHVERTLDGLSRDPGGPVAGLARFEGDAWRRRSQAREKIWTVSTAWGANAAAKLATLLADHGADATAFEARARELLGHVLPGGSLCMDTGYLPEQVFDDGSADSATPLGWPHAIRLATVAHFEAEGFDLEPPVRESPAR